MSTQNTAPDFGEPWSPAFRNSARTANGYDHGFMDSFQKRAIQCVNACAGMQDPVAEIQAMRAAIVEAHEDLSNIAELGREYYDMDMGPNGAESLAQSEAALAKLKPFMP